MIHHLISVIHLNNSIYPVHFMIIIYNFILIRIAIDAEMIGMIHGIGIGFYTFLIEKTF